MQQRLRRRRQRCGPSFPLAPETSDDYAFSYERGGRTQVRLTYFVELEQNVIDVLPTNYRNALNAGENPNAIGVPTNAGQLRSHGVEFWVHNGGFTLNANYNHTLSSSIYQFAFNDLNAPRFWPGISSRPTTFRTSRRRLRTSSTSCAVACASRRCCRTRAAIRTATARWSGKSSTASPMQVPNDNYVNPGYNYYFLKNPSRPYNATTNPYIANLGTNEGADPNTLRTTPQTLASLHVEGDFAARDGDTRRRESLRHRYADAASRQPVSHRSARIYRRRRCTTSEPTARSTARSASTRSATAYPPTTGSRPRYLGSTALRDTYPKLTRWPARP